MTKILIVGMGILFLCTGVLSATIINIPNDYPTIQQGIDASQGADTVLVQPGMYIENINFNGKNITVGSLFLTTADTIFISQTIIDGDQQGSVVTFESGEDTTAVLCGFTIINGLGYDADPYTGGGINVNQSSPSLKNLIVMNNHSEYIGGGMLLGGSNIELSDITVKYNTSDGMGGGIGCLCSANFIYVNVHDNNSGIYCIFSTISMQYVNIENNSSGGGLTSYDSELYLEKVTVKGNYSQYAGGGISSSNSDIILSEVIVTNNTSSDGGGGMYLNGNIIIRDTIVKNNSAYKGGGIFFRSCMYDIKYSVIANNISTYLGGGIYSQHDLGNIENSTIVYNNGGGIYGDLIYGLIIKNSIIANNTLHYGINISGGDCSIHYSDFWHNTLGNLSGIYDSTGINVTTNANGDSCDIYYNIQMDPVLIDPTNHDYHLQWCSPCIDAGDPNSPLDPDSTIADMGAYYYHQNVAIDNPAQSFQDFLIMNFPNPFSISTKISFSLPNPEKVKIQIYNLKGQLIETLLNENKPAGNYTFNWNSKEMSSGIYFCKLSTNKTSSIQKLMIIK